ncbi:MAG: acyl-CoA thioesterase [Chloroflexi bacterium]|nr:acyl-CoA thioesterase [Chloroflexota bacterium]OQY85247.1 MAG: hypothetical protein B6D42_03730 [Anaerolineae bacterium UTCFX5]RIK20803.1 MAG: hypothetical protein DCC53_09285 [Chloroflexota bacterium]
MRRGQPVLGFRPAQPAERRERRRRHAGLQPAAHSARRQRSRLGIAAHRQHAPPARDWIGAASAVRRRRARHANLVQPARYGYAHPRIFGDCHRNPAMTYDIPAPEGYRYLTVIPIRYGDMDTLGHVNNAKFLTYLEQSRVGYFRDQKLWNGSLSERGLIIARAEIDFRAPMTLDDREAYVWTRVSRLGTKSFDMTHVITVMREGQPVVTADSRTVVVAYDYTLNATVIVPDAWRSLVLAYEPALGGQVSG